jgi:hypothetical protein
MVVDRWYDETTRSRIASTPRVADRWYEETSTGRAAGKTVTSTPPARDAWYRDRTAPEFSQRAAAPRDLPAQGSASVGTSSTQRHLVVDRWYLDPAFSGEDQ